MVAPLPNEMPVLGTEVEGEGAGLPYTEEVVSVPMDKPLAEAYAKLEQDIAAALQEHRGNSSVVSTALNALLLYPDRPFSIGPLWGVAYDEETKQRERFLIADPPDLDESVLYAKERRLVEMFNRRTRIGAPSRYMLLILRSVM
jgi:hypothetical protein